MSEIYTRMFRFMHRVGYLIEQLKPFKVDEEPVCLIPGVDEEPEVELETDDRPTARIYEFPFRERLFFNQELPQVEEDPDPTKFVDLALWRLLMARRRNRRRYQF